MMISKTGSQKPTLKTPICTYLNCSVLPSHFCFSAIQQYVVDTLTCSGLNKKEALNLGPRYSEEFTFIAVINAAANWHKHSSEWEWFSVEGVEQKTQPNKLAMRTQDVVLEVAGTHDYPLSNVLAYLQKTKKITLSALLPNLILWRSVIDRMRK